MPHLAATNSRHDQQRIGQSEDQVPWLFGYEDWVNGGSIKCEQSLAHTFPQHQDFVLRDKQLILIICTIFPTAN